jgi:hypothetical protein
MNSDTEILKEDKGEDNEDKEDISEHKEDVSEDKKEEISGEERKKLERKERRKEANRRYREKIKRLKDKKETKKEKKGKALEIKTDMKEKDIQELPSFAEEEKRSLPMKVIFGIVGLVVSAILIIYFMSHNKKKSEDGFTIERN